MPPACELSSHCNISHIRKSDLYACVPLGADVGALFGLQCLECRVCGRQLTTLRGLQLHMASHSGHYPYQCEFCNKGFTSNSHLKDHLPIHTNKNYWHCAQCGSEFRSAYILKKHRASCQTGMAPSSTASQGNQDTAEQQNIVGNHQ